MAVEHHTGEALQKRSATALQAGERSGFAGIGSHHVSPWTRPSEQSHDRVPHFYIMILMVPLLQNPVKQTCHR